MEAHVYGSWKAALKDGRRVVGARASSVGGYEVDSCCAGSWHVREQNLPAEPDEACVRVLGQQTRRVHEWRGLRRERVREADGAWVIFSPQIQTSSMSFGHNPLQTCALYAAAGRVGRPEFGGCEEAHASGGRFNEAQIGRGSDPERSSRRVRGSR